MSRPCWAGWASEPCGTQDVDDGGPEVSAHAQWCAWVGLRVFALVGLYRAFRAVVLEEAARWCEHSGWRGMSGASARHPKRGRARAPLLASDSTRTPYDRGRRTVAPRCRLARQALARQGDQPQGLSGGGASPMVGITVREAAAVRELEENRTGVVSIVVGGVPQFEEKGVESFVGVGSVALALS